MFNRSYTYKDVLTRASMTIQIIDDVAIYKAQLFSSNGNIFGTYDKETDMFVVVYKGLEDITNKFTDIVWKRFSSNSGYYEEDLEWGEKFRNQSKIKVTKEDIIEKANIQCEVYMQLNGERVLAAADFISFVDINDMQGSPFPPENPQHGDLWLDTSVTPPRLMMWDANLGMWIEVKIAGQDRRNLIRNSNFYKKTYDFWTPLNNPILDIESYSAKRWARIKNNSKLLNYIGISQTVMAEAKSDYSFQILSEVYDHSSNPNGNLLIAFYSINENNLKTLIKEEVFDIGDTPKVYTSTFKSLEDTSKIELIISGEENTLFDFVFTNIKLENYPVPTEWELAIEDIQDALDNKVGNTPEEVFESLTDGGRMQGIYVDTDENGEKDYYFNATYIKSGKLLGEYIEGKNLTVTHDNGYNTLEIDNKGNVSIKANKLQITGSNGLMEDAATESDIAWKIDIIASNGFIFKNGIINTTLTAKVYKGKEDVTETLDASNFIWTRTSSNKEEDEIWNNTKGKGIKEVEITNEDVYQKASFVCQITE